ncbi:MAG: septation protein SepH [Streptosporangiaceae bacterium]
MHELRLVAVSEDGSYAVLVVPGRSGRFALPIDERLRTVARGQFSRLAQYEIEVESPLRPKEIQDRIRAGETAEEIADAAGLPLDRIRRFEGPVLAEREFRAKEAQQATVRSHAGPGPRLGEIVTERLSDAGANADEVDWDSRKRQDGNWQVQLAYTVAGRMYVAEWVYDPRSKHVLPDDDEAMRLCLGEEEWPEPRQPAMQAVRATVTPIGSRSDRADASHSDRSAGNSMPHPSRQAPSGVAANAGVARPGRLPGQAGEAVQSEATRNAPPAARRGRAEPAFAAHGDGSPEVGATGRDVAAADDGGPDELGLAAGAGPDQARPAAAETRPSKPARRSSGGRSRRSSVPSWDEIMFGNSRQPD